MLKIIKTHTKLKQPSLKNTTDLHLDQGKIQHIRFCMDLTLFILKIEGLKYQIAFNGPKNTFYFNF